MSAESWSPDGAPFVWLPKEALRKIQEGLEESTAASALLVYLALCRIACNEGASFEKPISYIATIAASSRRTVERRLDDLQRLKLLTVTRQKIEGTNANGLSRYTLTSPSRKVTTSSRNPHTSQSRKLASATDPHAVAVIRELEKERKEEEHPCDSMTQGQKQQVDGQSKAQMLRSSFQEGLRND